MPPRSPLPPRHGLNAAWVRTRDSNQPAPWHTLGEFLSEQLGRHVEVAAMLSRGGFVNQIGQAITGDEPYQPNLFLWFHKELRDEPEVPFPIRVLYRDERIVVVDKPPFLATIPRGRHVRQSVVVRLREQLGLAELSPAHRLDRLTSGVLLLTAHARWRSEYQRLFETRSVNKTYTALGPYRGELRFPVQVRNHLRKVRGNWQTEVVCGAAVNAITHIELLSHDNAIAHYRLTPTTGRTHQLRRHLADLQLAIVNDPLYPVVREVDIDDFTQPLELVARELAFIDPVTHQHRRFVSTRIHGQLPNTG